MFRIDKFLTIFELETGGQFIGYFGVLSCSFILTAAILVLSKIFTEWEYIEEALHSIKIEKDLHIKDPEAINFFKHALIASLASVILLQIASIISFILLIRGVKNRNPRQVKPSVCLFAMFTVLAIMGLFKFSPTSILNFVFNFYIFVVLFSLWKKFQQEQLTRGNHIIVVHHHQQQQQQQQHQEIDPPPYSEKA